MITGKWQIEGDGLVGYADNSPHKSPIWVELLADDICMGITLANRPEPNSCGFHFVLPPALLDEDIELKIRVANTNIFLERETETTALVHSALTGDFVLDRGLTFTGWALDPRDSEKKIQIQAFCEGKAVATTLAAGRRYQPGQADGHGFWLELPPSLADGQMHVVDLRDESGNSLPGSPVRICAMPENTSAWIKKQKKLDKPVIDLVCNMLEAAEERIPGAMGLEHYPIWKKAFPVSAAPRTKAAVAGDVNFLKNQQNLDLKSGSDFIFMAGGATQLHAQALAHMVDTMRVTGASLVYADGETAEGLPLFKPGWDREAFLAQDYLGPCLISGSIARALAHDNSPEARFEGIMAAAQTGPVVHLPMPLSITDPPVLSEQRQGMVASWLAQTLPLSRIENGRIKYGAHKALVSVIIPTRDHGDLLQRCLQSLWNTDWPDIEIIIVDNDTTESAALAVMQQAAAMPNVRIIPWQGAFNYAAINNEAARTAKGDLLCFLNNDTEALQPQWLEEMVGVIQNLDAGCVGAKLLWPNGLVQHGGVIVGTHQLAAHVGNQWLSDEHGYMNRNLFLQQYSAVTAACLVTPRELFLQLGGFDATRFPVAFNDVDYCLRVGQMGKKIYWTPHAQLAHHESASRGKDTTQESRSRANREMSAFRTSWGAWRDPFYNPNLHLSAACEPFLGLAFPPRMRAPDIAQP